jgi:Holliday junction resolvase RusA-like endonuclease
MSEPHEARVYVRAPERWINSNERAKRRPDGVIREWRSAFRLTTEFGITKKLITPFTGRVHITAELCFPDNRRRDAGNYYPTIKACIDGIVDAGLIVDDSDKYVDALTIRRGPVDKIGELRLTVVEVA